MRLVGARLSPAGQTFIGVLSEDGRSTHILTDVATFWAAPAAALASLDTAYATTVSLAELHLVPPVVHSARVLCMGANYRGYPAKGHEDDAGLPDHPAVFARWTASLAVSGSPVPVPSSDVGLDWGGEVAAFIGAPLVDADPDTARAAVFGYAAFNDITSRQAQKLTSQWTLGKNGDNSGPLGALVTADEVGDLRDGLRVQTRLNGETMQDGNTRDMIYELGDILSVISQSMTLYPGDLICTGTPAGVGYTRTPPRLMHPGDEVEVEIERIGTVRNPIVSNERRLAH